jgi:hypothetical protein
MLGYLAQVEYALARGVDCLLAGEVNLALSVELEDDFSLKPGDRSAMEWWQTKHSVDPTRTISDSDAEYWKALSAWIRHRRPHQPTKCFFLTTAKPAAGTSYLHLGAAGRDERKAVALLDTALGVSKSEVLKKHAEGWTKLTLGERTGFLRNVEVVHSAPQADQLDEVLVKKLRPFFGPRHAPAGATAVRGWWGRRVREHLIGFWNGNADGIDLLELEETINATRDRMREDDLPVLYDLDDVPLSGAEATFVEQLRMISLHDQRIAIAIQDHNRAFLNRSFWQRESLLRVGELGAYDERLKIAWRRHFLPESGEAPVLDGAAAVGDARARYIKLEGSNLPRIRGGVRDEFIATGSLHILADRLELGWHPQWVDRLRTLLTDDSTSESEGVA